MNAVLVLVAYVFWMEAMRLIFWGVVDNGVRGPLLVLEFAWMVLIAPPHSLMWASVTIVGALIISTGWTTIHLVRNKPLGWMRWPYLALVWATNIALLPGAAAAYGIITGPEAFWAQAELFNRFLNWLLDKTIGRVHPMLDAADKSALSVLFFGICCIPLCIALAFVQPIVAIGINAFALLGFLHAYWNRRITKCLSKPEEAISWQLCDVTMLNECKTPLVKVVLPTRIETFYVRHGGVSELPLELMQFDKVRARAVKIGFDKISNRPVAIESDGAVSYSRLRRVGCAFPKTEVIKIAELRNRQST